MLSSKPVRSGVLRNGNKAYVFVVTDRNMYGVSITPNLGLVTNLTWRQDGTHAFDSGCDILFATEAWAILDGQGNYVLSEQQPDGETTGRTVRVSVKEIP